MAADPEERPATSICFKVKVDGHDLGAFTACEGMGVEVTVEQREEGGNNSFIHQLPGRLKYTNVKLTRAVNSDTKLIEQWFTDMAGTVKRTNAHIAAMSSDGSSPIMTWDLTGVIPVRWTGPSLSAESAKIATETLELAHHGFLKA